MVEGVVVGVVVVVEVVVVVTGIGIKTCSSLEEGVLLLSGPFGSVKLRPNQEGLLEMLNCRMSSRCVWTSGRGILDGDRMLGRMLATLVCLLGRGL